MNHTIIVGMAVNESSYEDAREISSHELFAYLRRGYKIISNEYIDRMEKELAEPISSYDNLDLNIMKKDELLALARSLNISDHDLKGVTKAEIVTKIQEAKADSDEE